MNNLDKEYQMLLEYILGNGVEKKDRTGTGTLSIFGWQIRHKMGEGFPLLTTKKMYWKGIVTELLWFLRGDTNIKYLVDNDCHIWDGDAYKNYINISSSQKTYSLRPEYQFQKDEFINKIKTDDEFAKNWGDLGPVYGKQWRSWNNYFWEHSGNEPYGEGGNHLMNPPIDQIENLIEQLKTNPDSRRLMVNAWNVGELDQMTLPPCHYGFQVYTRELSMREQESLGHKYGHLNWEEQEKLVMPTRAISLMWNQRSVDTFLGLPFNIASYGLLLEIIAKEVNMVPDELIGTLGDVHLYKNHIEQAEEQIGRELSMEEKEEWCRNNSNHMDCPMYTREPYLLPTLNINTEHWDRPLLDLINSVDFCKCLLEEDIQLANYESHPTIKAPLNN